MERTTLTGHENWDFETKFVLVLLDVKFREILHFWFWIYLSEFSLQVLVFFFIYMPGVWYWSIIWYSMIRRVPVSWKLTFLLRNSSCCTKILLVLGVGLIVCWLETWFCGNHDAWVPALIFLDYIRKRPARGQWKEKIKEIQLVCVTNHNRVVNWVPLQKAHLRLHALWCHMWSIFSIEINGEKFSLSD